MWGPSDVGLEVPVRDIGRGVEAVPPDPPGLQDGGDALQLPPGGGGGFFRPFRPYPQADLSANLTPLVAFLVFYQSSTELCHK